MSRLLSQGWKPRVRSGWVRLAAMAAEARFGARLRSLGRRESQTLLRLGQAAEAAGLGQGTAPLAALAEAGLRLDRLAASIAASREADRADFAAVPGWLQPLVM